MYCPVSFENVVANAVSVHQENVTVRLAQHFHTNTTNIEAMAFLPKCVSSPENYMDIDMDIQSLTITFTDKHPCLPLVHFLSV